MSLELAYLIVVAFFALAFKFPRICLLVSIGRKYSFMYGYSYPLLAYVSWAVLVYIIGAVISRHLDFSLGFAAIQHIPNIVLMLVSGVFYFIYFYVDTRIVMVLNEGFKKDRSLF